MASSCGSSHLTCLRQNRRHTEPHRYRGPDWTPITPKTGSLFHACSQAATTSAITTTVSHRNRPRASARAIPRIKLTRHLAGIMFCTCPPRDGSQAGINTGDHDRVGSASCFFSRHSIS